MAAERRRQLRASLVSTCEKGLSTPGEQAHALRTLAVIIGEDDARAASLKSLLFAAADVLVAGDFDALERESRPRSIAAWAKTRTRARHGLPVERFLATITRNWDAWREQPGKFLTCAWTLGLVRAPEAQRQASVKLLRALRDERVLGRTLTPEIVARAIVPRSKWSALDKREDREELRRASSNPGDKRV